MRMRALSVFGGIATGMLIFLGAFGMALAQDEPPGDQSQEQSQMLEQLGEDPDQASNPPGRVAQLSDAEGSVSLEPAGTGSWTSAALNRPLTLGDKLWTDQNSRAELDIGDAVIRLGSTTGISILNLDDQTAQMQVTAGTVIVHVRSLSNGEQDEIDTPDLALTLQQPGTYRIEVSDSGDTTIVKVEDGEALATGGGQSYPVTAQQSVTFTGTSTLAADYATLGAPDSLDEWSMQREQQTQQQASVAQQYVPPDMVGGDDLGTYGTWQSTPDWGYAWFPTVAVGWAPYSLGNWVWISPWGWTWVDREPWGFAPFHYGRWGYWHRRWCWIPGPQRRHPVYAPALVAWVGGPRAGASVTVGAHVGWFPLGPRDVYVPGYRVSQTYVRNINLTNSRLVNTTEIGNAYGRRLGNVRYANSEVPGAITAVPRNVFTSAQPVGPHRVVMPHEGGINFRANTAAPAIMPVRESVLGVNAGRVVRTPPHAILDRPVVARLAPPRGPVSFVREQAAIRANGGRPVPMAELERMRPNMPATPVRLSSPPAGRPGFEARTSPESRGAPAGANMAAREHVLQQPSLPPRSDRPAWVKGRPAQPGVSMEPSHPGTIQQPQQRFAPEERQVPEQHFAAPQRQIPEQRFAPPERQAPEQHFTSPQRQIPEQRFAPPERQVPEQHFTSPQRQIPEQRFTPPQRQVPEQRFAPPERQVPEQRFAPPERQAPEQHFTSPERQVPEQHFTSPQRQVPEQHFAAPQRQIPEQRFAPPERQIPEQRFTPPERQAPEQRFTPPERQAPEQRFTPPERQAPEQRFTPPERQAPEQHFAPPERQVPEQRFAPPPERQMPQQRPPERMAPAGPPERRPDRRPP